MILAQVLRGKNHSLPKQSSLPMGLSLTKVWTRLIGKQARDCDDCGVRCVFLFLPFLPFLKG